MHNRFWYLLSKKLGREATDAEITELEELLGNHPVGHSTANKLESYWHMHDANTATDDSFQQHLLRMEQKGHDTTPFQEFLHPDEPPVYSIKKPVRQWRWMLAVAAGMVGVLLTWAVLLERRPTPKQNSNLAVNTNEVITHKGNRSKVVLPDGTQVWLNAESKLEYNNNFGKTNREVSLSGEAYFDVVKNEQLPFLIHTQKINIKVTGTAFNVRSYPGDKTSETALIRGRVEVTVPGRPDEKYVLKPNEKIVIRDEALKEANKEDKATTGKGQAGLHFIELGYMNYVDNDSLAVETSWLYNRLIFEDESFEEIARKMERWYGVNISIQDAKIAAKRFSYQIKDETIAEALRNMQYASRFHYTISNNHITITK
ncbi:MAG TPA: FecR domain-containing protein [Phnomibacter sp.]|nr:FecR domain-containing protein [Phnomibacter sp.]